MTLNSNSHPPECFLCLGEEAPLVPCSNSKCPMRAHLACVAQAHEQPVRCGCRVAGWQAPSVRMAAPAPLPPLRPGQAVEELSSDYSTMAPHNAEDDAPPQWARRHRIDSWYFNSDSLADGMLARAERAEEELASHRRQVEVVVARAGEAAAVVWPRGPARRGFYRCVATNLLVASMVLAIAALALAMVAVQRVEEAGKRGRV